MNATKGMNVDEVKRVSGQLRAAAEEITRIEQELTRGLGDVDWTGPDAAEQEAPSSWGGAGPHRHGRRQGWGEARAEHRSGLSPAWYLCRGQCRGDEWSTAP